MSTGEIAPSIPLVTSARPITVYLGMYIMVGVFTLHVDEITSRCTDLDIGNGCQEAFYDDPNILYISLHVHMNGQFYPSGNAGDMYHCGIGPGEGK